MRMATFGALLALWTCGCASMNAAVDHSQPSVANEPLAKSVGASDSEVQHGSFHEQMARARMLEGSNKLDEARAVYEQLIARHGDSPEPYHGLARIADRQQRYQEAQALYGEALRITPHEPEILNDLGYSFILQGKLEKAESALLKAVSHAPSNARLRNNLGLVYGYEKRYDEALESFRRAGSEADAQFNLAFVLAAQDDIDGAKRCFSLALAADSTHEPAQKALRSFEQFERDPDGHLANSDMVQDGMRWVPYVEADAPGEDRAARSKHATAKVATATSERSDLDSLVRAKFTERLNERAADR